VAGLADVVQISSDYQHACAVTAAGAAKCWGTNGNGELGVSTGTGVVTPTGLSSGVLSIAAGDWHTCAQLTTGAITCFGKGGEGQLGAGGFPASSAIPLLVSGF
jgi:alpha-tubulin suppressor-like RCC1 family protein